jgi:hypothetical protein
LRIRWDPQAPCLQVFFRLQDPDDYAAGRSFGRDIRVTAQQAHPAFERPPIESRFAFDLAVGDRRSAEYPRRSTSTSAPLTEFPAATLGSLREFQ